MDHDNPDSRPSGRSRTRTRDCSRAASVPLNFLRERRHSTALVDVIVNGYSAPGGDPDDEAYPGDDMPPPPGDDEDYVDVIDPLPPLDGGMYIDDAII